MAKMREALGPHAIACEKYINVCGKT